ncbi:MAG TPA: hypothetical protein VHL11_05950, partial [Phototrophicaceae bacterium]|nr:hypothetical protein [Phototrophicaceae bacterium]
GAGARATVETPYIVTGLSTQIDEDTGCVINPKTAFSGEVPRIYVTFAAYNLKQGTPLRADWYRDIDQVASGNWTVDTDYDELCIWFYIQQPQDVAFTPGEWSVRLFADNQQIGNTLPFTFEALPADTMDG